MAKKLGKSCLKAKKNAELPSEKKEQKLLKNYKIRDCSVGLFRLTISNSVLLQEAIFRQYGIRPCVVRLERMKKKLCLKSTGTVHSNSNISWLPTASSLQQNSNAALSSLINYQNQNNVLRQVTGRKTFVMKEVDKKKTIVDLNVEFSAKYNSPNHGLKPSADRQLREPLPKSTSDGCKIFEEFKAKLVARKAAKNE